MLGVKMRVNKKIKFKSVFLSSFLTFSVGVLLVPAVLSAQTLDRSKLTTQNKIKPTVMRLRSSINAELDNQGDYYFRPDGSRINMMRKKDVYVVETNGAGDRAMQRIYGLYGSRIENIQSNDLAGKNVIRVENTQEIKKHLNQQFNISRSMLKSADNSINELRSVFTNEQGEGDVLLLSKLTVKLNSGVDNQTALKRLSSIYGLVLDRKLRLSGDVYSLSIKNSITESAQFALVRSVMNDEMVEWAEPQFQVKANKASFVPNDSLFNNQWHLRNTGFSGSRCDTDCDANNAWGIDISGNAITGGTASGTDIAVTGFGTVIAIIDDGVQLNHPDLDIWQNPNELINGGDDDGNDYVDDLNGWDFVVDSSTNPSLQNSTNTGSCINGVDGTPGEDNNPSPQVTTDCNTVNGDAVEQDNHGTAVAGIAAAAGNNGQGVAGLAYRAEILPIRLISSFDSEAANLDPTSFCNRAAEAIEYAGRYADVVNNSWLLPNITCSALETAITNVTTGQVMDGTTNVSKRTNGSPVLFAAGNDATGWVKVNIPVSQGEHAYEWRFLRDDAFSTTNSDQDGDQAWLDDISWPDGSTTDFESGSLSTLGFNIGNVLAGNSCVSGCDAGFLFGTANWSIDNNPEPLLAGTKAAKINAANTDCGNTYLHTIRDEASAGNISFWVWVDSDTSLDKFEFLIDGIEQFSMGDIDSFVANGDVAYPANLSSTIDGLIAVGSSNSGDLSGINAASLTQERRAYYSQYGAALDVLAPSSDQNLGIVTTDRTGADGYNTSSDYANDFGGTSASAPIVSGISAVLLAVNPALSAADVKSILRRTTDKIGQSSQYVSDGNGDTRADFYGYGRVNMFKAILDADTGLSVSNAPAETSCSVETLNFVSASTIFPPLSTEFCAAIGEVPQSGVDELCFPISSTNGNIAVVCL